LKNNPAIFRLKSVSLYFSIIIKVEKILAARRSEKIHESCR